MKFAVAIALALLACIGACASESSDESENYETYCTCARSDHPCTTEYDPVCATNGCTFPNSCQLECARATLAYPGPCL